MRNLLVMLSVLIVSLLLVSCERTDRSLYSGEWRIDSLVLYNEHWNEEDVSFSYNGIILNGNGVASVPAGYARKPQSYIWEVNIDQHNKVLKVGNGELVLCGVYQIAISPNGEVSAVSEDSNRYVKLISLDDPLRKISR